MMSGAKPGPQGAVCVEHSVPPRQGKARTTAPAGLSPLTARSAILVSAARKRVQGRRSAVPAHTGPIAIEDVGFESRFDNNVRWGSRR